MTTSPATESNSKRRSMLLGSVGFLLVAAGVAAVVVSSNSNGGNTGSPVITTDALEAGHRSKVDAPNTVVFDMANLSGGQTCKIVVQLEPKWAPVGVQRVKALVEDNYFDGCKFFRNIEGFIAQFGLNGNPQETAKWDKKIRDDPSKHSNSAGTLTFATAGPGTRTTQLFFNAVDNNFLDDQGFAPVGKITSGQDCVRKIRIHADEGGPDQGKVQSDGDRYLDSFAKQHNTQFTEIKSAKFQ